MNAPETVSVLGVRVDAVSPELTTEIVERALAARERLYLVFCTVSSVLSAHDDPRVKQALEGGLVNPDGMPLVWLAHRAGHTETRRVYGPDFMLHFFESTGGRYSHFFYGGGPGVADEMVGRLKTQFPALRVAGTLTPAWGLDPFSPPDADIDAISAAAADVVWVGVGHPKQELFMHANAQRIGAPVLAGVGAAFDFHSGRKNEAPSWMKRTGLQWLHRLAQEPRRLWRRYLIGNSRFVYLVLRERLRGRRAT